jgi:hypothetical protein
MHWKSNTGNSFVLLSIVDVFMNLELLSRFPIPVSYAPAYTEHKEWESFKWSFEIRWKSISQTKMEIISRKFPLLRFVLVVAFKLVHCNTKVKFENRLWHDIHAYTLHRKKHFHISLLKLAPLIQNFERWNFVCLKFGFWMSWCCGWKICLHAWFPLIFENLANKVLFMFLKYLRKVSS